MKPAVRGHPIVPKKKNGVQNTRKFFFGGRNKQGPVREQKKKQLSGGGGAGGEKRKEPLPQEKKTWNAEKSHSHQENRKKASLEKRVPQRRGTFKKLGRPHLQVL